MANYYKKVFFALFVVSALFSADCSENKSSFDTVALNPGDGVQNTAPLFCSTPKTTTGEQTAVFAGGCFWDVEAVFQHVK